MQDQTNSSKRIVKIYCDGACSGNPGPGGWAFIIPELDIEKSGYTPNTTNNRMEMTAAIEALQYIYYNEIARNNNKDLYIEVVTDSQYVVNTLTKGWRKNKNHDLWALMEYFIEQCNNNIQWVWVKGHSTNKVNQRCDELAVQEYKQNSAKQCQDSQRNTSKDAKRKEFVSFTNADALTLYFKPVEKYDIDDTHYFILLKCNLRENVFAAVCESLDILKLGTCDECKEFVYSYSSIIQNTSCSVKK